MGSGEQPLASLYIRPVAIERFGLVEDELLSLIDSMITKSRIRLGCPYDHRMRWTEAFVREFAASIGRLGLSRCSVCDSDQIATLKVPVILPRGGLPGTKLEDADTNIDYYVKVECTTCGNAQFYNSERYRKGDEQIIQR